MNNTHRRNSKRICITHEIMHHPVYKTASPVGLFLLRHTVHNIIIQIRFESVVNSRLYSCMQTRKILWIKYELFVYFENKTGLPEPGSYI